MSILEQENFIKQITPFNRLSSTQLDKFVNNLDIKYYQKNETILTKGEIPCCLYFVIKGIVQEYDEDEQVSIYTKNEYFDPITLIENRVKHSFVTTEETIVYTLSKEIFLDIMYKNEELESYFFQSISKKLNSSMDNENTTELVNFMISRVKDAYLQKPIILKETETIFNAVSILKENRGSSLLVEGENELGIVTDTDFRERIVLNGLSFDEPISKITTYGLKTIDTEEFLFNAQIKMNKHKVKRLIVKENDKIVGVLDLIALTSFFASHTYSVMLELDNVTNIEELKVVSEKFINVIKAFHAKGVKVRYISKIISQLNNKLFEKLFEILAPENIKQDTTLIIMGSEGRGEQILRTDQDNALIISDSCQATSQEIADFATTFTEKLVYLGYPKCEGNIMVSNPYWRKNETDFRKRIDYWSKTSNEEDLIKLAIFFDSLAVAGNKQLLVNMKKYLSEKINTQGMFLSFFATPILNFATPISMFSNFVVDKNEHKDELDIKKGGIFPIVHGVRTLALKHKIRRTNTIHRIKDLNDKKVLSRELAEELIEAYTFLMYVRLNTRLDKINQRKKLDNYINPDNLTVLEKDLLKDSFKIVDKFKKYITTHFGLDRL